MGMTLLCSMSLQSPRHGDSRPCPDCGATLAADPRFAAWCPACEWNADHDEPPRQKLVARFTARQADWLARRLYADISSHPDTRRRGPVVLSLAYLLAAIVHLI